MKIILFGNKGQVGREIKELAQASNIELIGFDIDNLDITAEKQLQAVFAKTKKADLVINAAAYTAVDKAEDEKEKAFAVNSEAVKNIAILCKKNNLPLLHISTDYVFSGEKESAYTEFDLPNPLGVYGKSKLAGDEILKETWDKHIILRVSWVFGTYGNNFVKTILRLAQEREVLNVVGDQFGCPTAAKDIARVLLEIAEQIKNGKNLWGVYNYCNSPVTNWYDFALKIIELGKNKYSFKIKEINEITTDKYPTKAIRPKNSELQVKKIIADFGVERHEWSKYLSEII